MGLSIGLEALTKTTIVKPIINLDVAYADFMESYTNVIDQLNYGRQLFVAYENLCSIQKTVKQYGFTKSLEALIGHQLGTNSAQVSTEAEEAKEGVWKKIKEFLANFWQSVKDFFAKFFNTSRGVTMKLDEVLNNVNNYKVKEGVTTYKGLSMTEIVPKLLSYIKRLGDPDALHDPEEGGFNEHTLDLTEQPISDTSISSLAKELKRAIEESNKSEAVFKKVTKTYNGLDKIVDPNGFMKNVLVIKATIFYMIRAIVKSAVNFLKAIKLQKENK